MFKAIFSGATRLPLGYGPGPTANSST